MRKIIKPHQYKKNQSGGFTIVELLIATAVFSMVLLGTATMVIQVSRMYYKGIVSTRTQNETRALLEAISRPIQLEEAKVATTKPGPTPADPPVKITGTPFTVASAQIYTPEAICVGATRITFVKGLKVNPDVAFDRDSIRHAVWIEPINNVGTCKDNVPNLSSDLATGALPANVPQRGRDLISKNMRLVDLKVVETPAGSGLWSIKVKVLYGERDLMGPANAAPTGTPQNYPTACKGFIAGSQWCTAVEYETKVFKRLKGKD